MTEKFTGVDVYYPLATGNKWTYKMLDGNTYTNSVIAEEGPLGFAMHNSMTNTTARMRKENGLYLTDSYQPGLYNVSLKENANVNDTWEVKFAANNFDNLLIMTVREIGVTKEIEGKTYHDVMMIEAESKLKMNGNLMSLNFFTQYYYAKGVGLILTTTSHGDRHYLVSYELN